MQTTYGEYTLDNIVYSVLVKHSKTDTEALLVKDNTVVSAYKKTPEGAFSYNNNRAKGKESDRTTYLSGSII